jgi:WD40 repeat protein
MARFFYQDNKTGELIGTLDTTIYPLRKLKQAGIESLLSIQSLAFSRNGHILAAGRLDGTIILWDMKTRKPLAQFTYTNLLRKIVLSADGQILVASGDGNTFTLWNVAKRIVIHTRAYQFQPSSLALSSNGRLLAASVFCNGGPCEYGQQIILWDVATDTLINRPVSQAGGTIFDLAFSPDGNTLAWSSEKGITLWNVITWKPIGQTLSLTSEQIFGSGYYDHIAFSSNGKILVLYTTFGSGFILWDVTTSEPFTSPFDEGAYLGNLNDVALSPNGQQLVSVGFAGSSVSGFYPNQGIVTLWNMSLESWENQACSIANRNLTRDEWRQFVVSEPFGKVCPDLPLS